VTWASLRHSSCAGVFHANLITEAVSGTLGSVGSDYYSHTHLVFTGVWLDVFNGGIARSGRNRGSNASAAPPQGGYFGVMHYFLRSMCSLERAPRELSWRVFAISLSLRLTTLSSSPPEPNGDFIYAGSALIVGVVASAVSNLADLLLSKMDRIGLGGRAAVLP